MRRFPPVGRKVCSERGENSATSGRLLSSERTFVHGQNIDLNGYKLSPASVGLVPVFDHDVRGRIHCGDTPTATAKIDLIDAEGKRGSQLVNSKTLHAVSSDQGSFHVWVPAGSWMLIVRARCEKERFGLSLAEVRVGHLIRISSSISNQMGREVAIEMQAGKMEVIKWRA